MGAGRRGLSVLIATLVVADGSLADHRAHRDGIEGRTEVRAFLIDSANPYSPCDRYTEPYADCCWLFQGFVILRAVDFDADRALGICDVAPKVGGIDATRASATSSPGCFSAAICG